MKQIYLILLISSIIFFSCTKETSIVEPPATIPQNKVIILSDTSARAGEKIFAYSNLFKSYTSISIYVDNLYAESKMVKDTIVAIFIPKNVKNGIIKFVLKHSPTLTDTVLDSQDLNLLDDCSEDVCINWNTSQEILESDSWWTFDADTVKWSIETHADSIFIKRNGYFGDEGSYLHTIVFKNNSIDQLPTYLFAVRKVKEWLEPDINDTISTCNIVIDKWNSDIYSGTFLFDDFNWIFFVYK